MQIKHGGDIYSVGEALQGEILDFSANINPLGMPEEIKKAIVDNIDSYRLYPDPLCRLLRSNLAKSEGLREDMIYCGNGAADVLFRIAGGIKPRKALLPAPTFSEYEASAASVGCAFERYVLSEENGFMLDEGYIERIRDGIDMVFICNPNNPTGLLSPLELIERCAARAKEVGAYLLVDECFLDFTTKKECYSAAQLVNKYKNLIILKAFTKIYAMAGLRLGYMLSSDISLINRLYDCGQPWNVSAVASAAGVAALNTAGWIEKSAAYAAKEREYLLFELKRLKLSPIESEANFILIKSSIKNLSQKLKKNNILVRECGNFIGLSEEYYRLAVRTRRENMILIDVLERIVKEYERCDNSD